ncbi:MAG: hypothetical protein IMF06_04040 [Proteobacteria bacterium]|nr:hypothetical protein [Pseudomonadota bacterium]
MANSSEIFRDWIEHDYISGFYGASITPSSPITQIYLKKPLQFDAVIKNESPYTIPLSGNKSGVHFAAIIEKADGSWRREKRGEFIELDLTPGKSVELHMKLPRVPKPGDYSITLDLVEERVAWFHEMGSPAYQTNVAAR